ncbi:hypothetical protein [Luteolibacter sp. LG18]|uniref:hypothetical protein n=1 Tax=Luteolibacter sp. LG18 TaxID=2819286 RepID=UPI002B304F61|nr:hypothetical protein llg_31650 [Luteolibacter sp. LG18]
MKISSSLALSSVLLGCLLVSCKKEEQPGVQVVSAPSALDIPILKVEPGDFWTYQVRIEIPAGVTGEQAAAVDTTHERTRTYLGKVPFVKGAPEVECFEVVAPNSPPTREYVNILDDRIELRGELLLKDADSRPIVFPSPVVFVKAGLQAGDSIQLPSIAVPGTGAMAPRSCAIIGREDCVVPAGSFPSVRMLMHGVDGKIESRRTIWFSPGNGIVKEERVRYAEGKVIVKESHELAKKGHRALTERPAVPEPK